MENFSAVIVFFYFDDKVLYSLSPEYPEIKNNTLLTHKVFVHIVARKIFGVEINLREFKNAFIT
jgi:hypothetical protein